MSKEKYTEIPFEKKELGVFCTEYKTDCPFGVRESSESFIKVGSAACAICLCYLRMSKDGKSVICNYPDNIN